MTTHPPSERELVRKLVADWHQSGDEQRTLPGGWIRGSLVFEAIEEILDAEGRYPVTWQPDDSFACGLIERRSDGEYRVTWRAEFSMMHHEAVSVRDFASRRDAVASFARPFFGGDIDGIPIDWSA
jgi:hypothetical protein